MKEVFKDIKDFPYSVSNLGRVYSKRSDIYLRPGNKRGYLSVILQNKGKRRQVYVHVLVAEAFLKKHKTKKQVNHIDGDKQNNKLSNLEYLTPLENTRHAIKLGIYNNSRENNGRAKLASRHIKAIKLLQNVLSGKEVAFLFGVGKTAINDIWNNRTWN